MRHLLATAALAALTSSAFAAPAHLLLPRTDGSIIHYSVDTPPAPVGTLVLAQGSGCAPTASNGNFAVVRQAFPNHVAVMVEKYGVTPDSAITDGFVDCPPEFHAGHTVSQRVADYEAVLATLGVSTRPLVLFGGSEGGLAVAMLSQRVAPNATILLSSATGIAFADMVLSTIPPEGQEPVRAGLAAAKADPEGLALFAGSSHRFWADIMDHVSADYMLDTDTPFLVIQGGRDSSAPVAAARATADRFSAAGKCNLTYWEFPALDHGMADPGHTSHLAKVAAAAAAWATDPSPPC